MRILFTLIAILFFSFNNANASWDEDVMTKGIVIAYFLENIENKTGKITDKVIILKYQGAVCECRVWQDFFRCKVLTVLK